MTAGQLAALIAAVAFAVLAAVGVWVLIRMARLFGTATTLLSGYAERTDTLLEQAQAAVDRTNEQLLRADAITASMDEVTANVAELSGHVATITGVARALAAAVGAPVSGIAAVAYGVRHAVALRRPEAASRQLAPRRPEAASPPPVPSARRPEVTALRPVLRAEPAPPTLAAAPGRRRRSGAGR
jgi:uncharacterized protein YoxC